MTFQDDGYISDFSFKKEKKTKEDISKELKATEKEIEIKNEELKKLIENLKELKNELSQFEIPPLPPLSQNKERIDKNSVVSEKIKIYLEYFCGRTDVYAQRVWNKKRGKVEYYPKCINQWKENCPKKNKEGKNVSCATCLFRKYEPLTDKILIDSHFRNESILGLNSVGMYAMKEGDLCSFIAIDLDENNFEDDARAILTVARESGFPMIMERSFSGKGIHLWLFFDSLIKADKARIFAFLLLDNASIRFKSISLKSYDRIFPTQDKISKDGLGNLILLPFVYFALKRGCTVFLDDNFKPYDDQFKYLSSIPKCTEHEIDKYIDYQQISTESFFQSEKEENIEFLWVRKLPKIDKSDIKKDILPLHFGSGITIRKTNISN